MFHFDLCVSVSVALFFIYKFIYDIYIFSLPLNVSECAQNWKEKKINRNINAFHEALLCQLHTEV